MNYHYIAFGLKIESEFEIPEFLISEGTPDVYIGVGEVPEKLPNPLFEGVRFQASPDHFLLHVDRIARYFAEGGHTITIQPYNGSSDSENQAVFIRIRIRSAYPSKRITSDAWKFPLY
ncbi:MAG: hypothetical protein HC905_19910 [Bacteroidales bacterium]|nr:hypothetical protein [Bacteroidales bacterium]